MCAVSQQSGLRWLPVQLEQWIEVVTCAVSQQNGSR